MALPRNSATSCRTLPLGHFQSMLSPTTVLAARGLLKVCGTSARQSPTRSSRLSLLERGAGRGCPVAIQQSVQNGQRLTRIGERTSYEFAASTVTSLVRTAGYLPMKRERDAQRSRVYKADLSLKPFSRVDVSTVPLMEAYVARVWSSERVRQAYPAITVYGPPKIMDGCRRKRAAANDGAVAMPQWARYESLLIHELAHTVTRRICGRHVADHGWQYCSVYLKLTLYMMGREAHDALRSAFKWHRVRYSEAGEAISPPPEKPAKLALAAWFAARRHSARVPQRR